MHGGLAGWAGGHTTEWALGGKEDKVGADEGGTFFASAMGAGAAGAAVGGPIGAFVGELAFITDKMRDGFNKVEAALEDSARMQR